jgi:hypothetical protein
MLVILTVLLSLYLNWIVGVPYWISVLIATAFLVPPASYYTNIALLAVYSYVSIGVHIYTIIFAFTISWWKALLTIILPGISEIYWFVVEAKSKEYKKSIFCIVMLVYAFGLIVRFLAPLFIMSGQKETKKGNVSEIKSIDDKNNGDNANPS